jgi:hypothetical protein
MIETYPAALQHQYILGILPLHIECNRKYRSAIISKRIELYPEALAKADMHRHLPLHQLLQNKASSIDDALMMIEKYPLALERQGSEGWLPIHIECSVQSILAILLKCIELYPEALREPTGWGELPLHTLLTNRSSSIDCALALIEKYPAALQHRNQLGNFPLRLEIRFRSRPSIIPKCIELNPDALDCKAISGMVGKVNKSNFHKHSSALSIIFTYSPLSIHNGHIYAKSDIRSDPPYRRRILNLLPRHVFTRRHYADYRKLNWKPRAVMMTLLSRIEVQHSSNTNISRYHR